MTPLTGRPPSLFVRSGTTVSAASFIARSFEGALAYVVEEHIAFDELCEKVALRWDHIADAPACLDPLRHELLPMTEELSRALRRHFEHEELVVFPLVVKYVPQEVQARELDVIACRAAVSKE